MPSQAAEQDEQSEQDEQRSSATGSAVVACSSLERLLLVPIVDGTGDLDRAASLDGLARSLWNKLAEGTRVEDLPAQLVEEFGILPAQAEDDVRAFVDDLVARGLMSRDGMLDANPPRASACEDSPVGAGGMEALARAVLDQGHKLRFCARGLSMRPQLPHGSILEISPRSFEEVRVGDIALYSTGEHRMVAHRVVARRSDELLARGDSAARLDTVDRPSLLGVVTARIARDGKRIRLDDSTSRISGLLAGFAHRCMAAGVRVTVVLPLRKMPVLRRILRLGLSAMSRVIRFVEERSFRWRRRIDVGRAALLTAEEKNEDRRKLYARKSIQDFTALDENVEAGLTLIEEVLLRRHAIPAGRALVLGCGPGRECVALARRGFEVTGLDREERMLVHARSLAGHAGASIRFVPGEADAFDLPGEMFATIVVFSGLYNMLLPRARRVAMLRASFRHLEPGGRVLLTFLSDYAKPQAPPPSELRTFWSSVNPDHEEGDLYLLNEAVHIFPHADRLAAEAREAGFEIETVFRDQRAYDRSKRQVRGYAILVRPSAQRPQ